MANLNLNTIFYSDKNINMAYKLKKICRELGISVINAFDVPQLSLFLNEINMCAVFIDCTTLKINENIVSFIKSYNNSKNNIIIAINSDNCKCNFKDMKIDYIIPESELQERLKQINSELVSKLTNRLNVKVNYGELNSFLTNYLISIGVAPKHMGFIYIKQAIELSLKLGHGVIGSLSKDIYPTVASLNRTVSQNVERNIRNAIENACKSEEIQKDNIKYLINNNKISNRAFLCYLLDKIINVQINYDH